MKSVFEIIPYILEQSEQYSDGYISPLKLQKLLYYSQAWSLVFRKRVLFSEDIEAWVYGPVIPSVYHQYKHHGRFCLPKEKANVELNDDEKQVLNLVLKNYASKSPNFLKDLTHSEYPWLKARQGMHMGQRSNQKISLEDMTNYYSKFKTQGLEFAIHPMALKNKEELAKNSFMNNIVTGMGSILEILPRSSTNFVYVPEDFADPLSDWESLYSDWENVGNDFKKVIDLVQEQSSNNNE